MRPKVAQWLAMNVQAQNDFIGSLLGAEPLAEWYIKVGEKTTQRLWVKSAAEADDLLTFVKTKGWRKFAKMHGLTRLDRLTLSIHEHRWHARYADTSAGGWSVIEFLRRFNFNIQISSSAVGWKCHAIKEDKTYSAASSKFETSACVLAIEILAI